MPLRPVLLLASAFTQALPPSQDPIAASLLQNIEANPNDVQSRLALANEYRRTGRVLDMLPQLVWLVENDPESSDLLRLLQSSAHAFAQRQYFEAAKPVWEHELESDEVNATTDFAAGLVFESTDANRALALFEKAQSQNPGNEYFAQALARIYAKAYAPESVLLKDIQTLSPEQAAALKTALQTASDPALIGKVGENLAMMTRPPQACPDPCQADNQAIKSSALTLLQDAANLQPDNSRWPKDIAMLDRITTGALSMPTNTGAQRIGGQVAEANLIRKVQPVYPPLAQAARVQGSVEFAATINESGNVVDLHLVRGHPLLVSAAREAVLQWQYRPTLLNGQPVSVVTNIVIPFRLPEDSTAKQ